MNLDKQTREYLDKVIKDASLKELFKSAWWSFFNKKRFHALVLNIISGKNWKASFNDAKKIR